MFDNLAIAWNPANISKTERSPSIRQTKSQWITEKNVLSQTIMNFEYGYGYGYV